MEDWIDIQTPNNLHYVFWPETSGVVKLQVKAANDAHIALTDGPFESNPMTEIHIGGWNNTKSIIRRDRRVDKVEESTRNILNRNAYVSIWIRWHNNEISAGLKGRPAFIKYFDPEPHPINHVAVRTGWDATGLWKIRVSPLFTRSISTKPMKGGELRWVRMSRDDQLPLDALIGGYENGEVLYIARAMHNRSQLPGKYVLSQKCGIVGWGLHTFEKNFCEVLCGYNAAWVKTKGDIVPPHAFFGGYATETSGEPLFIGRVRIGDHLIPGKVHCHYKTCYIPYKDVEKEFGEYEVLVQPDNLPDAVIWNRLGYKCT